MDISKAAQFYHSDSKPLGKSYGEWTVEWWRWVYRLPKSVNPLIDSAGDLTIHNQSGKVWFLGGKPADKNDNLPIRNCSIPEDVSLLFPIINYEANQIEFPSLTEERLVEDVKEHMKLILKKDCYINGISIPGQRVKSNPFVYDLYVTEDNVFNVVGNGNTKASADGYWVFLKPLTKGKYVLEFSGSCSSGDKKSGAVYHLNII